MQSQTMKDFPIKQYMVKGESDLFYKGGLEKSVQTCQDEPGYGRNVAQQL